MTESSLSISASHPLRGERHGVDDAQVARAAAEVPGERFLDLLAAGVWLLVEERFRGQEHARGAVAALGCAELDEGGLEGVQLGAGETFDRHQLAALHLDGKGEAGEGRA